MWQVYCHVKSISPGTAEKPCEKFRAPLKIQDVSRILDNLSVENPIALAVLLNIPVLVSKYSACD